VILVVFKKGHVPWNRGKKTGPLSAEHRHKISEAHKGKRLTEEHKRKIGLASEKRVPWNKGKHLSEETKRKISESLKGEKNPNYRKTFSEDTKRKMSEAHKGKTLSEETKNRMSIVRKKTTNSGRFKKNNAPWNKGKPRSKETREKIRAARLNQVLPIKDTSIEVAMQAELSRRSILFEKHVPLFGKYLVDIKIRNLIVECDGNYWHSFPDGLNKDRRRDDDLKEAGYNVLRFWGSEIREDVSACVDRILEEVTPRLPKIG